MNAMATQINPYIAMRRLKPLEVVAVAHSCLTGSNVVLYIEFDESKRDLGSVFAVRGARTTLLDASSLPVGR